MENGKTIICFPIINLEEILVSWENCLKVKIEPISNDIVNEMKNKDFDYAPVVLSDNQREILLGLISRKRLESLKDQGKELNPDDSELLKIDDVKITIKTSLDCLFCGFSGSVKKAKLVF